VSIPTLCTSAMFFSSFSWFHLKIQSSKPFSLRFYPVCVEDKTVRGRIGRNLPIRSGVRPMWREPVAT
jgi:hypothetical protein